MNAEGSNDLANRLAVSDINVGIPRKVYYDGTSARVLYGMLFLLLTGAVWFVWTSYDTLKDTNTRVILKRQGSMATGIVTKRSQDHNDLNVRYKFVVDGVPYLGQAEMKADYNAIPPPGEQIQILYLPADPHVNQPTQWYWFSAWDIFRVLYMLLVTVIAAVIISVGLRQKTLASIGIVVEGRVTSCTSDKGVFKISYRFVTEDSTVIEGGSEIQDEYEEGALIPVIYLPHNPKRNDCYPVAGFRVAD